MALLARSYPSEKEEDPQNQVLVGATEVTRDTARGTALTGMQYEVYLTAASEYVETDKERRAAENSDQEESGTISGDARRSTSPQWSTTCERPTSTRREARMLYQLFTRHWQRYSEGCPKMHEAFPYHEILISKGKRFINFRLSLYWFGTKRGFTTSPVYEYLRYIFPPTTHSQNSTMCQHHHLR